MEEFRDILKKLELKPQDLSIYQTAFTHRSYLNEVKEPLESNERLEFLGDAVLSYIVSSYLFKERPQDKEGDLTNLRAYIVKTESLAKISQQLKLGNFLRMSRGELASGGRENHQILANTYEAVLGAIFLDQGTEAATSFVHKTLLPIFAQEIKKGAPRDPKSQLQEEVQSKFQVSPGYKVISTSGPDHAKEFKVGVFIDGKQIGEGIGTSKQQAEEESARQALLKLTS